MQDVTSVWGQRTLADVVRAVGARVVGIAGPPGGGKSTLARATVASLPDALVVSTDDYYLSKAERRDRGMKFRGPPGSHDVAGLIGLLDAVRSGRWPITVRRFSSELDDRLEPETYENVPRYLLLEGLILGYRGDGYGEILDRLDLLVFLDVDEETAKARRFAREGELRKQGGGFSEEEMQQFWDEVLGPATKTWVRQAKEEADLVIQLGPDRNVISARTSSDSVMAALEPR
jgi:D-glycerate 3-kinase